MPSGKASMEYGGVRLEDATYAVVETAYLEEDNSDELGRSDLMMPVLKEVDFDHEGFVSRRHFYLADTDAFVDPCCCIPDIGGPKNRYFVVKPRNQWSQLFTAWVEDPHRLDEMDDLDSEVEEDQTAGSSDDQEDSAE
jgi:hypothetical protein